MLDPAAGSVLVMMLDHHLGNFVISMPVLAQLLDYFEQKPVLLVNSAYESLARAIPNAGQVMTVGFGDDEYRVLKNLRQIRCAGRLIRRGFDVVIDLTGHQRTAMLARLSMSAVRVGFADTRKAWLYSHRVSRAGRVHAFEKYASILKAIGKQSIRPSLSLDVGPEAIQRAHTKLGQMGLAEADKMAVIHPCAGYEVRQWPVDRFATVGSWLVETGYKVCIIGTPGEAQTMRAVRDRIAGPEGSAFCLHASLDELVAVFERASIIVSNESGPTHLAALTDLPIVTIFGPSDERIWRPMRDENTIVLRGGHCHSSCSKRKCFADNRCLKSLEVETVIEAAAGLLGIGV